jgi:hypothetical protein
MQPTNKSVTVKSPANMTLAQAQQALATVLGRVGHPACYSGFNISFVNAVDPAPMVLNVDQGGKVVEG